MKRKGKAKLCCWCRLPGGRAIPGTSVWSRFSRNDSKRSSSTVAAPAGATNRRAVTQSASLLKIAAGLLKHMHISRCHAVGFALGGQIVQALGLEQPDLGATLTIAAARRLAELIPSAELILVPGVKHMTFSDGSAALEALQDFLARHPIGTS